MSMLIAVFGILYTVDFFYSAYWEKLDMLRMLEWVAENDFLSVATDWEAEFYHPVYAVLFNENGEVLDTKASVSGSMSDKIIQKAKKIRLCKDGEWRWDSCIYVWKERDAGNHYLVFTDMKEQFLSVKEILGNFILLGGAFGLLLGVSFFLSRFVTQPAQQALDREKQFISDAGHELKTPLAAILINVQVLSDQMDKNKYLDNILSETKRMDKLIHRLLKLAYLEERETLGECTRFSLSESCEEVLLPFESVAFENQIQFSYEIAENIEYNGNSEELKQVFAILLDNAFKYTERKGEITVRLQWKNNRPIFTIHNTGEGIAKEDLPHIFERFYRSEKSRNTKSDSFGLGLSIAQAIVTAHKGTIYVESKQGEYAKFVVEL